jgi:hypothetical protein
MSSTSFRIPRLLVVAAALLSSAIACTANDEDVHETESDDLQFPAGIFAGTPTLTYGTESRAIASAAGTQWKAARFVGKRNDPLTFRVATSTPDRVVRAYLVIKKNGVFSSVPAAKFFGGQAKYVLPEDGEYFLAFGERRQLDASFKLLVDLLPGACVGAPLSVPELVARTKQGMRPGIVTRGTLKLDELWCEDAGCSVVKHKETPGVTIEVTQSPTHRSRDYIVRIEKRAAADTIPMFSGEGKMQSRPGDDIASGKVSFEYVLDRSEQTVNGAIISATDSCVGLFHNGQLGDNPRSRYELTFSAATPARQPARTAVPDAPPAPDCDGPVASEADIQALVPASGRHVKMRSGEVYVDRHFCHPLTGCSPWKRERTNYMFNAEFWRDGGRIVVGVRPSNGVDWDAKFLNNGTFEGISDMLQSENYTRVSMNLIDDFLHTRGKVTSDGLFVEQEEMWATEWTSDRHGDDIPPELTGEVGRRFACFARP